MLVAVSSLAPDAQAVPVACDPAALVSAIETANESAGTTTLDLAPACIYTLTVPHNAWYGPNALPPITSTLVLEGHGAEIRGLGATPFRLFYVSGGLQLPAGSLTLRQLTLSGGRAKGGDSSFGGAGAGMGGAIFNQGTLVLDAVTLTGNTAQGGAIGNNAYAGGGMGEDAQGYTSGGFGPGFKGGFGGLGGSAGTNSGGGGGGFLAGANGANGSAGAIGADGGGSGGLGSGRADGGKGGNVGQGMNAGGAGGGGVGGGGGAGAGSGPGNGGNFGFGGHSGGGTGGSGGFGGGGGWAGGGFGTTGGAGGFGGGGAGSIGGVAGFGGFGGGNGSPNNGNGGGGGGLGGAVFNHGGTVAAVNTTMTGNSALGGSVPAGQSGTPSQPGRGLGGALFNLNGDAVLTFCTLAANTTSGGGADGTQVYTAAFGYTIADGSALVAQQSLDDSILWATPESGVALVVHRVDTFPNVAQLVRADANIVQGTTLLGAPLESGPATFDIDPELGPLAENGGPTKTMALPVSSVAVDLGEDGEVTTDQRGTVRDATPDVGAYELVKPPGEVVFGDGFE